MKTFDELTAEIQDVQNNCRQADRLIAELAYLCAGRLRSSLVPGRVLNTMKRELRAWDIHRGTWKDAK